MARSAPEVLRARFDRIDRRRRARIDWQYWPAIGDQGQYVDKAYDLDDPNRPDIEDDAVIAWGLAQCDGKKAAEVKIDVLSGNGIDLGWFLTPLLVD